MELARARGRAHRRYWRWALAGPLAALLALSGCGGSGPADGGPSAAAPPNQAAIAAHNPDLDPGTSLRGAKAPEFLLLNQYGELTSLAALRGHVVVMAFLDTYCATICPLTTVSMLTAKKLLGPAGDQVRLVGIVANPRSAARTSDTLAYSRAHGMADQWDFLTGPLVALRAIWRAYHVDVQIESGRIDHTPALYVIDEQGREQKVYLIRMSYASVGQQAQVLASEIASLLPGHPKLTSDVSLAHIGGQGPGQPVTLPAAAGGTVPLGPGQPRLVVFFGTWLNQGSVLGSELAVLNQYAADARTRSLPRLVAVDELPAESSAARAESDLAGLAASLDYPIALDRAGRLADGYGVTEQPWYALVSAAGKIMWSHAGWLPLPDLEAAAAALRR